MASSVRSPLGEVSNMARKQPLAALKRPSSEATLQESASFSETEDAYLTEEEELELDMVCRNEMLSLGEEIPEAVGERVVVQVDLPTRSRRKVTRTFGAGNHVEDVAFWAIGELAAAVSEEEVLQGDFRDERETWRVAGWELTSRALRASFSVLLEETLLDVGLTTSVSLRLQHSVQPTSLSRDALFPVDEGAEDEGVGEYETEEQEVDPTEDSLPGGDDDESLLDADITQNILSMIQQSMQDMKIEEQSSAPSEAVEGEKFSSVPTSEEAALSPPKEDEREEVDGGLEEYDTLNDEDSIIEDLAGLCISSPAQEYVASDEEEGVESVTAMLDRATLEEKEETQVMQDVVFDSESDIEDSEDDEPLTVTRPEALFRRRVIIDESDDSDKSADEREETEESSLGEGPLQSFPSPEALPLRHVRTSPLATHSCVDVEESANETDTADETVAFASDEDESADSNTVQDEDSFFSACEEEAHLLDQEGEEGGSFYDANSFLAASDGEELEMAAEDSSDVPANISIDLEVSSIDLGCTDDDEENEKEVHALEEERDSVEWNVALPSPVQQYGSVLGAVNEMPSIGVPPLIVREEPMEEEVEEDDAAPKVPWMRRVIESDSESESECERESIPDALPSSPTMAEETVTIAEEDDVTLVRDEGEAHELHEVEEVIAIGEEEDVILVEDSEGSDGEGSAGGKKDLAKALTSAWNHSDDVLANHCGEDGSVPHLLVKLHKHQRVGVNWMVTRELETHKDIVSYGAAARGGGILADDMGLGKTIQTLGLVLCNPSSVTWKGTLIVCTLSTVKQWEEEVANRVQAGHLKVCLYYGPRRTKDPHELLKADVVLTTYGIMSSEFAKAERGVELIDPEGSPAPVKKGKKATACCLYRIHWWRVVLDEAHAIKNRSTKKHKAACALEATHHWCLTGTPIENSPFDLYSLLHFSQAPECHNVRYFKSLLQDVKNSNSPWAFEKLKSLIQPSLLRRKKAVKKIATNATVGGERATAEPSSPAVSLPPLPPCTVHNEILQFSSADERTVYDALWNNAQQKFIAMQKKGTVLKNVMTILELILRCRQACVHPYLLIATAEQPSSLPLAASARAEAVEETDYALANRRVKAMAHQLQVQEEENAASPLSLASLASLCAVCLGPVEDPILLLPCRHSFCRECVVSAAAPLRKCGQCGAAVARVEEATRQKRRPSVDPSLLTAATAEAKAQRLSLCDLPDKSLARIFSFLDFGDLWTVSAVSKRCYAVVDALLDAPLGSTKVDALVTRLQEGPACKSIVFSQFSTVLNVVQHRLHREGIAAARLDGSMPLKKRASEIERFKNDPSVAVFLISLKAGCCGLNLSEATQVFLMDPWWNPQVEQQAIDRVHRMGQKKPVTVWRYIVGDTLEEQILRLQDKKRDLSEAFLGQKGATLSAEDISELFAFAPITTKQT